MKYLESEIHGEESRIQDCLGFFYMGQTFSCQDRDVVNTFYLFVHLLFNLFKFNKQLFSNTVTFLTKVGLFLPSTRSYVLSISLFERSSPKGTSTFPRTLRNKGENVAFYKKNTILNLLCNLSKSHLRVPKLSLSRRLSANINGFTISFAFKQRLEATRRWPISFSSFCDS